VWHASLAPAAGRRRIRSYGRQPPAHDGPADVSVAARRRLVHSPRRKPGVTMPTEGRARVASDRSSFCRTLRALLGSASFPPACAGGYGSFAACGGSRLMPKRSRRPEPRGDECRIPEHSKAAERRDISSAGQPSHTFKTVAGVRSTHRRNTIDHRSVRTLLSPIGTPAITLSSRRAVAGTLYM
jgi:hypothetical protein